MRESIKGKKRREEKRREERERERERRGEPSRRLHTKKQTSSLGVFVSLTLARIIRQDGTLSLSLSLSYYTQYTRKAKETLSVSPLSLLVGDTLAILCEQIRQREASCCIKCQSFAISHWLYIAMLCGAPKRDRLLSLNHCTTQFFTKIAALLLHSALQTALSIRVCNVIHRLWSIHIRWNIYYPVREENSVNEHLQGLALAPRLFGFLQYVVYR